METILPKIGDLVQIPSAPRNSPISVLFPKRDGKYGVVLEVKLTKTHPGNKQILTCSVLNSGKVEQFWFDDIKIVSKIDDIK